MKNVLLLFHMNTNSRKWNGRTPPSLPWSDNANSQLDTNKYFAIALFCFAIFNIFSSYIYTYVSQYIHLIICVRTENWFFFSFRIYIFYRSKFDDDILCGSDAPEVWPMVFSHATHKRNTSKDKKSHGKNYCW